MPVKSEVGQKAKIKIEIDEEGRIIKATTIGGKPLKYESKKTMENSKTKLRSPNYCCWKKVAGVWVCKPRFC